MGILYHGSSTGDLKRLEPRKSTHGNYVYATDKKIFAIHFSKRCGDDLTYTLTKSSDGVTFDLIERIPGAFEKMYTTSSYIYTVDDSTFKDIKTGFREVVSEVGVDTLSQEYIDNLYEKIMEMANEGLINVYTYPNRPGYIPEDDHDLIKKQYYLKEKLNKQIDKHNFDRLLFLHPNLLEKINECIKDFGIDYQYTKEDIVNIFDYYIERSKVDTEHELYIDNAYKLLTIYYPELVPEIDVLLDNKIKQKM